MIATTAKKLVALMAATAAAIALVSASASTPIIMEAEAQIAINEKGVKVAEGQIVQEAGHWGIANSINQQACTNEISQAKVPE